MVSSIEHTFPLNPPTLLLKEEGALLRVRTAR
jgi:hypothetical protein